LTKDTQPSDADSLEKVIKHTENYYQSIISRMPGQQLKLFEQVRACFAQNAPPPQTPRASK